MFPTIYWMNLFFFLNHNCVSTPRTPRVANNSIFNLHDQRFYDHAIALYFTPFVQYYPHIH